MNQKLCLLICFFVGILVFYLLKNTCGCKVVEGSEIECSTLQNAMARRYIDPHATDLFAESDLALVDIQKYVQTVDAGGGSCSEKTRDGQTDSDRVLTSTLLADCVLNVNADDTSPTLMTRVIAACDDMTDPEGAKTILKNVIKGKVLTDQADGLSGAVAWHAGAPGCCIK